MAQFDVHQNPNPATREAIPFLIDIQSDFLSDLGTRIVAPLVRARIFGKPIKRLNIEIRVRGQLLVLSTAELAGIPRSELGPVVGSAREHRDQIVTAIDLLITGI